MATETDDSIQLAEKFDSLRTQVELLVEHVNDLAGALADAGLPDGSPPAKKTAKQDGRKGARRAGKAALPDPRALRAVLKARRQRAKFFNPELFADPAWDMLLDLAAALQEGKVVSVSSLCIAAGVPGTTALRWINVLIEEGLFVREGDGTDRRRSNVRLTDKGARAVAEYFDTLEATPRVI